MDAPRNGVTKVRLEQLADWQSLAAPESIHPLAPPPPAAGASRFPVNADLNKKLKLWKGELVSLEVDVIVNPTNETLTESSGISSSVLSAAGPELMAEILTMDGCRTGQARITKGHNLVARSVFHTVGPRFNVKYQTAAENALHNCYRSCLQLMMENKMTTIGFPVVNSEKKRYPPENGAHIAIRTVRRFMEQHGANIDTIVLCVDRDSDFELYNKVLRLYFPRTDSEETDAFSLLPADTGNENGETVVFDRMIRIAAMPFGQSEEEDRHSYPSATLGSSREDNETAGDDGGRNREPEPSPTILSTMYADPDETRRLQLANKTPKQLEKEERSRIYNVYLRRARVEDLSDIARLNIIYHSGNDSLGRAIIVVVARHLPAASNHAMMERFLLYMIRVMHPIVERPYALVYFHTNMSDAQQPEWSWLKDIYGIFDWKYGSNLKALYCVHPGFWLKTFFFFLSPFISKQLEEKLKYISSLRELMEIIPRDQLNIPNEIFLEDQKLNGGVPPPSSTPYGDL